MNDVRHCGHKSQNGDFYGEFNCNGALRTPWVHYNCGYGDGPMSLSLCFCAFRLQSPTPRQGSPVSSKFREWSPCPTILASCYLDGTSQYIISLSAFQSRWTVSDGQCQRPLHGTHWSLSRHGMLTAIVPRGYKKSSRLCCDHCIEKCRDLVCIPYVWIVESDPDAGPTLPDQRPSRQKRHKSPSFHNRRDLIDVSFFLFDPRPPTPPLVFS